MRNSLTEGVGEDGLEGLANLRAVLAPGCKRPQIVPSSTSSAKRRGSAGVEMETRDP